MQARSLNQSLEGIKAIASLGGGAIVIFVVYQYANAIHTDARARAPGGYGGVQANDWIGTGLDVVLPALFLFLVFFGLIMAGIKSRRYA